MDQRCYWGNCQAYIISAKTQKSSIKNVYTNKSKEKSSALQYTKIMSSKKMKKWQQNKKNANAAELIGGNRNANRNLKKYKQGL